MRSELSTHHVHLRERPLDHRPVDGVTAAQWMRIFIGLLENPAKILAQRQSNAYTRFRIVFHSAEQ